MWIDSSRPVGKRPCNWGGIRFRSKDEGWTSMVWDPQHLLDNSCLIWSSNIYGFDFPSSDPSPSIPSFYHFRTLRTKIAAVKSDAKRSPRTLMRYSGFGAFRVDVWQWQVHKLNIVRPRMMYIDTHLTKENLKFHHATPVFLLHPFVGDSRTDRYDKVPLFWAEMAVKTARKSLVCNTSEHETI